jgi:NADPH-dependent curcumin reductase CurA
MSLVNHQVRLAARPAGLPAPEDWSHTSEPVPDPAQGQFVAKTLYLSLDPAMRGWLRDTRSYVPPVGIGEVMRAGALVEVTDSNHPDFASGDHLTGMFGVQEYVVSDGAGAFKVEAADPVYLGALGMTGLTAYFGLFEVGALQRGETVVVSAAAGAVGSMAGQIAKVHDCRVVGIAGGEEKCRLLTDELGFDAAIDYKRGDVRQLLRAHVPDGIDVYFDNVGGEILDAALANLRMHARVVICGAISQYNEAGRMRGPANYMALLVKRARMQGFLVFDYADRYREAAQAIAGWIAEGRIHPREQVVRGGVQDFPETLLKLFRGENTGKLVLDVTATR